MGIYNDTNTEIKARKDSGCIDGTISISSGYANSKSLHWRTVNCKNS